MSELEWVPKPNPRHATGTRCADSGDGGRYSVAQRHFGDSHEWVTEFSHPSIGFMNEVVHYGKDEAAAVEAARRHHDARIRRLKWERYMLDNDPPERESIDAEIDQPAIESGRQQ